MKASLNGLVLADAPEADLVKIEGNRYFPPASVNFPVLEESPTSHYCPWTSDCTYFTITVDGAAFQDRAFAYRNLRPGAVERVGHDFAD
jgi:uncharacterized protein (DUF427 family)